MKDEGRKLRRRTGDGETGERMTAIGAGELIGSPHLPVSVSPRLLLVRPYRCVIFSAMEVARKLDSPTSDYEPGISKKFTVTAAAVVLIAAVFGGTVGSARRFSRLTSTGTANAFHVADEIEKDYNEAVTTITSNYSGDIDYEKATQAAIQGMLSTLDPHSSYFSYSEFKKLKEDQDSRFYGIGVTIVQHRDGVYIQSAVEGTPAAKLG